MYLHFISPTNAEVVPVDTIRPGGIKNVYPNFT